MARGRLPVELVWLWVRRRQRVLLGRVRGVARQHAGSRAVVVMQEDGGM